jgi:glutamyl-Q tRNA(Asp) synthetase
MNVIPRYHGRFAPSPTGPLHFGSLVAAVGSYLQARSQGGRWSVRIDDIDPPREMPGAADAILRTLDRFGLHWDGPVIYQSRRMDAYVDALTRLAAAGMTYPCVCSRRDIAEHAGDSQATVPYPGTCRQGVPPGSNDYAIRVRVEDAPIRFVDRAQGRVVENLNEISGDFVVRRRDGLIAYHLAVVVDDAEAGITEIVRGCDLLDSTARQVHLQRLLNLATPDYLHLPVAVDRTGQKLSKQNLAAPVDGSDPVPTLSKVMAFLGQGQYTDVRNADPAAFRAWAIDRWNPADIPPLREIRVDV